MSTTDTMSTTDELTRVYKWGAALTGAVILALATGAALLGQAAGL